MKILKVSLILFITTIVVYIPSLFNEFVYDDYETIVDNPYITSLKNINSFFFNNKATSPSTHLKYEIYRPLKTLTTAMDYFLFKKNPLGYHVTNLLLHYMTVILIFYFLNKLNFDFFSSLIASLFFSIHPALSHNVSYISGRADIIGAIFILLSLIFFLYENNKIYYLASLFLFFLGCLGKETAIMYPLILLFLSIIKKTKLKRILPFFGVAFLYLIIRQSVVQNFSQTNYYMNSFFITQATMLKIWAIYFTGFFWPLKTLIIPVISVENTVFNIRTFLSLLYIISLFYGIKILKVKNIWFYFGLFWFIIFLLPASNLIPIKAFMSWRFVYIPWIGFSIVLAAFFDKRIYSLKFKLSLFIWFISIGCYTFIIASNFKNDLTLWKPLTEKYPFISKPYRVIGYYYLKNNNYDMAKYYFDKGLKYFPDDDYLNFDMAKYYFEKNEFNQSIIYLEKVKNILENETKYSYLYYKLYCLYNLERYEDIIASIDYNDIKNTPIKVLLLQAHSLTLLKKIDLSRKIYEELLNRKLNEKERKDCQNILELINNKK